MVVIGERLIIADYELFEKKRVQQHRFVATKH